MTDTLTIAIDFNNTIAETDLAIQIVMDAHFPEHAGKKFDELTGLQQLSIMEHIGDLEAKGGLIDTPMPDAAAALWNLRADGHHLFILTANPASIKTPLTQWLEDHMFPPMEVKTVGPGKHHHKQHKNFDIIIDDNDTVIRTCSRNHHAIHFRGTMGYSHSFNEWRDILTHIRERTQRH